MVWLNLYKSMVTISFPFLFSVQLFLSLYFFHLSFYSAAYLLACFTSGLKLWFLQWVFSINLFQTSKIHPSYVWSLFSNSKKINDNLSTIDNFLSWIALEECVMERIMEAIKMPIGEKWYENLNKDSCEIETWFQRPDIAPNLTHYKKHKIHPKSLGIISKLYFKECL